MDGCGVLWGAPNLFSLETRRVITQSRRHLRQLFNVGLGFGLGFWRKNLMEPLYMLCTHRMSANHRGKRAHQFYFWMWMWGKVGRKRGVELCLVVLIAVTVWPWRGAAGIWGEIIKGILYIADDYSQKSPFFLTFVDLDESWYCTTSSEGFEGGSNTGFQNSLRSGHNSC